MACDACSVSVVIPAYNAGPTLHHAVESVLAQTLPPKEIIVVDDGSTDGTASTARSFGDRLIYLRQRHAGVSAARNRGIMAATANWIAFLDADDLWLPQHLDRCWDVITNHSSLVWCCAAYEGLPRSEGSVASPPDRWKRLWPTSDGPVVFFEACRARAPIGTCGMVIRREVFHFVGVFDPQLQRGEDRDLWYRIAISYPQVGFVWPPTWRYVSHEQSLSARAGDESDRLVQIVARNVVRLRRLEGEARASFEGVLQQLARDALFHSLNVGRPDCLGRLVREYGWLLSAHQQVIASCASRAPAGLLRWLGGTYRKTMGTRRRR